MPPVKKREFLPLAHVYEESRAHIGGWYVSEKLDGQRALWDGGISRGKLVYQVPYANHSMESKQHQVCTGLWSRYGNVVHAPDFWLDGLPNYMLDGELYIARKQVQTLRSIVSRLPENRNDSDWEKVKYFIYGLPSIEAFTQIGVIKNQFHKSVISADTINWVLDRKPKSITPKPFEQQLLYLERYLPKENHLILHNQFKLSQNTLQANEVVNSMLKEVIGGEGEGLVVSEPTRFWTPIRSKTLLKVKGVIEASATIVGFKSGEGKYRGMLGSLKLNFNGIIFYLSGMDDNYRQLADKQSIEWAQQFPEQDAPAHIKAHKFRVGESINFDYNGTTDKGTPKEARFTGKVYVE